MLSAGSFDISIIMAPGSVASDKIGRNLDVRDGIVATHEIAWRAERELNENTIYACYVYPCYTENYPAGGAMLLMTQQIRAISKRDHKCCPKVKEVAIILGKDPNRYEDDVRSSPTYPPSWRAN